MRGARVVSRGSRSTMGLSFVLPPESPVEQNRNAQFLAVCSVSILAETLGSAASLSSPLRGKGCVFEQRKPLLTDQLQPSTTSDKLSDPRLEHHRHPSSLS